MISERNSKEFCKDDIRKVENYEQAINDEENIWEIHHRLEFTLNGEFAHTSYELKRLGMYNHRPYYELIFMKSDEHRRLHRNGKMFFTEEAKKKAMESKKGFKHSEETKHKISEAKLSVFGIKFKEHYGITKRENEKLYKYENNWYRIHNKTYRWEI